MRGISPLYLTDFYKCGHQGQYPDDVTQILTNWTPRYSHAKDTDRVVHFGTNYAIKRILMESWQQDFFDRPWESVRAEYVDRIRHTLFISDPAVDHLKALHDLGYLPIRIYALPEGSIVPLKVPPVLFMNTIPDRNFRWLPNYLETIWSNFCWKPSTSATVARKYRELFLKWARRSGETDFGFVDYMGHDFSFRGMSGLDDAILSGMGHLLFFRGTDTIPAIIEAQRYYGGVIDNGGLGCSIPATEHSVMCAGGEDGEFETFHRLLTKVYPSGPVSIVSDTWDLWRVLTDYLPRMRPELDARDGKLVIRPDSGDPVKIICGDKEVWGPHYSDTVGLLHRSEGYGTLRLMAQAMGITRDRDGALPLIGKPHPLFLNTGGAIYGDSITPARAEEILQRTVEELRLSPYNMVFGIGSFTYEYTTRDVYGWAMKATAVRCGDGAWRPIFKKPVTDNGEKFSAKGLLAVYDNPYGRPGVANGYYLQEDATEFMMNNCCYETVYDNGRLLIDPKFETIRERARAGL